jgi:hypothetical protein
LDALDFCFTRIHSCEVLLIRDIVIRRREATWITVGEPLLGFVELLLSQATLSNELPFRGDGKTFTLSSAKAEETLASFLAGLWTEAQAIVVISH